MITMALFHDLSEIKYGDVPGFLKTEKDVEREKIALEEIAAEYKLSGISDVISSVRDFDEKESKEAKIVNALDKLEGLIQHNEADLATWIEREYELNLSYGIEECQINKLLYELRMLVREKADSKMGDKCPARKLGG
jgi:5'-deoxynucleotidase YfbR-like HD superfamily hydrolase